MVKRQDMPNCESSTWLTAIPNRLKGTYLTNGKRLNKICLSYNLEPLDMASFCDGCGAAMTVKHALKCKVGGLVHIWLEDSSNKVWHLYSLATSHGKIKSEPYITSHGKVKTKPYIYSCPDHQAKEVALAADTTTHSTTPPTTAPTHTPGPAANHQCQQQHQQQHQL